MCNSSHWLRLLSLLICIKGSTPKKKDVKVFPPDILKQISFIKRVSSVVEPSVFPDSLLHLCSPP